MLFRSELTLKSVCIEALWLSAFFTLDQGRANLLDLCAALLFSPNKITDVFAVVGVVTTFDLRLDPVILLIRQRNSLADSRRKRTNSVIRSTWPDDQIVEPLLFVCRGFDRRANHYRETADIFLQKGCRLRDSNPRPTVYKTVALPLC